MIFSPCQAMHVVELPKFRKRADELTGPFDVWCYFLKHAADLDSEQLPSALHSPTVERALEVLNVISKTDLERERYLAAERWERDHRMYVRNAEIAKKEAEIAKKNAENAEKKGMVDRIQLCQRFLKVTLTDDAVLYALSIEELEARVKTWEAQLLAKS